MGKRSESDLNWSLDEDETNETLQTHRSSPLLFGALESEDIIRDLEKRGILDSLRKRGYHNFHTTAKSRAQYEDRFLLLADHEDGTGECMLFDVRTHSAEIPWDGRHIKALYWDWLEFRDPKAAFRPDRPPLPGQEHPGLGVFGPITRALRDYVGQTDTEVIVAIPEYFHNAWLYSRVYRFENPEFEGRFRALVRDILPLGLAEASHAVNSGQILENSTHVFAWPPEQQVYPLNEATSAHFSTDAYLKTVAAFEATSTFRKRD